MDVLAGGRIVRGRQRCQAEEYQQNEQTKEDRCQDLPEAVDNVRRVPTQVKGDPKKDQVEDDRGEHRLRAGEGRDGRREGDGTRSREGVEGADGQVDQDRENEPKGLSGAADKIADIGAG